MLRSASFAFFEMLRVCCGPQASRFCRVTLRIHDVHCGSSMELLNDAIGRDVVRFDGPKKKMQFARANMDMLATEGGRSNRPMRLPSLRPTLRPLALTQKTDDCQRGIACWAGVRQWSREPLDYYIPSDTPWHPVSKSWHSIRNAPHAPRPSHPIRR